MLNISKDIGKGLRQKKFKWYNDLIYKQLCFGCIIKIALTQVHTTNYEMEADSLQNE